MLFAIPYWIWKADQKIKPGFSISKARLVKSLSILPPKRV